MSSDRSDIRIAYSESWGCWLANRGPHESIGGTIEIVLAQVGEWMRESAPAYEPEGGALMGVERTIYCDNPTCADDKPGDSTTPCHVTTATPAPYLPIGIIETRERSDEGDHLNHFCSWDCVMKYAAKQPVAEIIEWGDA